MSTLLSSYWPQAERMPRDFSDAFERLLNMDAQQDQSNVVTSEWTPRVDIREEDDRFVIAADIPGVDPSDIEVHMEKGVLSIRGERKVENTEKEGKYTRIERAHGVFHRRFALPDSANPEAVKASGKHGVLQIDIPKRPETTARRINIDVES